MIHHSIKCTSFIFLLFVSLSLSGQNIGINTTGTKPSANAILDLNTGNNRDAGFILPHANLSSLTTFSPPMAHTNTADDTGMMVYNTNASIGNGAGCYCWNGSQWVYAGFISNKASYQASPSNPTGTSSASVKMMGLAGFITPTSSGTVLIVISGYAVNSHGGDGDEIQIYTGTGTAPSNGDAATGNAQGSQITATLETSNSEDEPFTVNAVVSGLTIGTTYWIDLGLATTKHNGTASLGGITISAIEG